MTAFLQQLPGLARGHRVLSGLVGGAVGLAIARMAALGAVELPLLVVAAHRDEAEVLAREIRFHLGEDGPPVLSWPADDVRPYEGLSPHPDLPRQRLVALDALARRDVVIVVTTARALQQKVLPPSVLTAHRLEIGLRQLHERGALLRRLVGAGYVSAGTCDEPGTFAARGGVVDLWPAGHEQPYRVELFDDEVDDLRALDPNTQRSVGKGLTKLTVLPAREALLGEAALQRAAEVLAAGVDAQGGGQATRKRALQDLREGIWFPGAEDYLAALHPLVDPLDYAASVVVVDSAAVDQALDRFDVTVTTRWESAHPEERPPVPPSLRYVAGPAVRAGLRAARRLEPLAPDAPHFGVRGNESLRVGAGELGPLAGTVRGWLADGWQISFVADTAARAERLRALLEPHGLRPRELPPGQLPAAGRSALWVGDLERGFHAPDSRIALITSDELFAHRAHAQKAPKTLREAAVKSFTQLKPGDWVVHARHGVGRFEGLTRLPVQQRAEAVWGVEKAAGPPLEQDFAILSYRGGDRMYLPVTRLDQLAKYQAVGAGEPTPDKLGGETWAKKKSKVHDRVLALAHEILRSHALRAVARGHAYLGEPDEYQQFVETFPHVETPDQEAAIADVLADLAKPEPMDRLIIGDVGFGKTEVAMRAAMRVILDGYQVAVLCPTTVLAYQHAETFKARFADLAVNIELLSRFRDGAETTTVLEAAAKGGVDILIGTHALLSRALRFKKLGLVVVDEEHRFGVKQKDKLKKQWPGVDWLAMSATPIPRTLYMALSGVRAVSLITTPPAERQAIRTRIARWTDALVREEILFELQRGGQVFFVHNRVASIGGVADRVRALVPEARVGVATGQMDAPALERVLVDFVQRRLHVLVSTAIIENGIDLPNVNTMLVDRADTFGLAQLYQLRGRVGRGHVRGNCILLVPHEGHVPAEAMRRLSVLQENTELGAGFAIANADLELRGAGDLLGEAQHGHIEAVGLDTYLELLEQAVAEARGEEGAVQIDPEIDLPVSAVLPEAYIPEIDERLIEYRRLAVCRTVDQVRELIGEWEDRFGRPPPEVLNLGWLAETRARCRALAITRLSWLKIRVVLDFHPSTRVRAEQVAALVQTEPGRFALPPNQPEGAFRLEARFSPREGEHPFRFLHGLFERLEAERLEAER